MSRPAHIDAFLDSKAPILEAVDEVLDEWNGKGCLQFPTLLGTLAVKLNWEDKQVRANDPIIREFLRNHPKWCVTRGAHGGIMRKDEKQKKLDAEEAKAKAKADAKAAVEAKLLEEAAAKATATTSVEDNTNIETIITE